MAVGGRPRAVILLQACIRGYLVRKKFRSLRQDYESVVKEIEGGTNLLEWDGKEISLPKFRNQGAKIKGANSVTKRKTSETLCPEGETNEMSPLFEDDEPEKDCCASRTHSTTKSIPAQSEQPDVPGTLLVVPGSPDQAPDEIEGVVQVLEVDKASSTSGDERKDSDNTVNFTDVTSVWNSTMLEVASNVISAEPLCKLQKKEMPTTREGLQKYRSSLAMELLWLQQAIASRKNYLILKERLGTPER